MRNDEKSPSETGVTNPTIWWIVDWDLPSLPTLRVRLWRWIARQGERYHKSSESVITTQNKKFAHRLCQAAWLAGATRVSLYRAVCLSSRHRDKIPKLLSPPCMWEREILGED